MFTIMGLISISWSWNAKKSPGKTDANWDRPSLWCLRHMTSGWRVTQVLPLCELPLNKKRIRVRKKEVVIDSLKLGFYFLKTYCIVHVLNVHRSIEDFLFVSLGNAWADPLIHLALYIRKLILAQLIYQLLFRSHHVAFFWTFLQAASPWGETDDFW